MVKKTQEDGTVLYQCEICKLHFTDKSVAEQCQAWCEKNNSCNYEVASQSLEAQKKEN